MAIQLLDIIINPNVYKETCFLCFKNNTNMNSIYADMVFESKMLDFVKSVSEMMLYLFPSHEMVLQQVCEECTNLIIKMYIIFQNYKNIHMNLNKLITNLNNEIMSIKEDSSKCFLNMDLSRLKVLPEFINCNTDNVNKVLECTKCNMQFHHLDTLQEHKRICHKNTNEAVVCDVCGKSCKTPSALKCHLNCHNKKQCPYCFKYLKTHSHYRIHLQRHVSNVKRHRNNTCYNCHHCNYVSINKGSLEAHINKVHLDVRPHVCQICCKGFFKKSHLTEHVKTHSKVKNETCEVCGENFASKKTLLQHLRLHKDEKPYECEICFKKFVTSGRRSDHIKRQHREKTECCVFCNKMFSLRKELNRHLKKSHNQQNMSNPHDIHIT